VQLSVFSTGPGDQLAMARAFVRAHGDRPTALLFTLDQTWCDASETTVYPHFPFWLYDSRNAEYARNIFSPDAVEAAFRRLAIRAFGARPAGPADGYDPQEPAWPPDMVARDMARARPEAAAPDPRFPHAARLAQLLSAAPAATQVALVVLPHYISFVPVPGSPAAAALEACKAAFRTIAESRSGVTFIDFLRDDAAARDGANFADVTHAHDGFVRVLTQRLAPALRRAAD